MPIKQRIDIIERAAADQRAQHLDNGASTIAPIEHMCDNLKLRLQICPGRGVMLGGAYSRLQLWVWEDPDVGGIIWLSADLDPELRRFAIAHELGHYVLHRGEGIRNYAPCDERAVDQQADAAALRSEDHVVEEYSPRVRREQEANAFAAELLAPRAEVRRVFTSGANDRHGATGRPFRHLTAAGAPPPDRRRARATAPRGRARRIGAGCDQR